MIVYLIVQEYSVLGMYLNLVAQLNKEMMYLSEHLKYNDCI